MNSREFKLTEYGRKNLSGTRVCLTKVVELSTYCNTCTKPVKVVTKEEAEKAALANPQSAKWMEGFTVAKVIVVPGKMINIVLKK